MTEHTDRLAEVIAGTLTKVNERMAGDHGRMFIAPTALGWLGTEVAEAVLTSGVVVPVGGSVPEVLAAHAAEVTRLDAEIDRRRQQAEDAQLRAVTCSDDLAAARREVERLRGAVERVRAAVAELPIQLTDTGQMAHGHLLAALADADTGGDQADAVRREVEQITAERDEAREFKEQYHEQWMLAEAEVSRLRGAVEQVRALTGGPTSDGYQPCAIDIDGEVHLAVLLDDLRAALADADTGGDQAEPDASCCDAVHPDRHSPDCEGAQAERLNAASLGLPTSFREQDVTSPPGGDQAEPVQYEDVLAEHVLYGEEDGPFVCGCKAEPPDDAWEQDHGEDIWHRAHVAAELRKAGAV